MQPNARSHAPADPCQPLACQTGEGEGEFLKDEGQEQYQ